MQETIVYRIRKIGTSCATTPNNIRNLNLSCVFDIVPGTLGFTSIGFLDMDG